jgi:hypothetical protein
VPAPATEQPVRAAFRFHQRDHHRLRTIATLSAATEDQGFFHKAAESAQNDEPLIVVCTREELRYFADRVQHWNIPLATDALTQPNRKD